MSESDDQRRDEVDEAVVEGLLRTDFGRRVDVPALLERVAQDARQPLRMPWWRRALPAIAAAALVSVTAYGAFRMGTGLSAGLSGLPERAATPWGSLEDRARFAFGPSTGGVKR